MPSTIASTAPAAALPRTLAISASKPVVAEPQPTPSRPAAATPSGVSPPAASTLLATVAPVMPVGGVGDCLL